MLSLAASTHLIALLLVASWSLPSSVEGLSLKRRARAIESASLVGTPGKTGLGYHKMRFTSAEDNNSLDEDLAEDYDFVLDLNEHDDFDRLLNMLSRSGPAKHLDSKKKEKSSTFLDHHDELTYRQSDGSILDSYKGIGFPAKAHKIDSQEEGSRFDDVQREKEDAEQKKLEELYFEEVHAHTASSDEETDFNAAHSNTLSLNVLVTLLIVSVRLLAL